MKNIIQIVSLRNPSGKDLFQFKSSIKTDTEEKSHLCSAISAGVIDKHSVICTAADRICILFIVKSSSNSELLTERKLEFVADQNETGCINCCMVTPAGDVITACDDGMIRIWGIDTASLSWSSLLLAELFGHTGPVMALSIHPSEPLLSSASKDGTLKLWSLLTYRLEDSVCCSDGVSGGSAVPAISANTSKSNATTSTPAKANSSVNMQTPGSQVSKTPTSAISSQSATIECRGCCFTPCGTEIIAIQSGKRGAAFLVKWKLNTSNVTSHYDTNDELKLKLLPIAALQISKVPCTRLCISSSGRVAAIGSSDGSIILVHNVNEEILALGQVHACHQLPVTGITFAPPLIRNKTRYCEMVISCSADLTLAMNAYNSSYLNYLSKSFCFQLFFILFTILLTLLLIASTLILFESYSPHSIPISQ